MTILNKTDLDQIKIMRDFARSNDIGYWQI